MSMEVLIMSMSNTIVGHQYLSNVNVLNTSTTIDIVTLETIFEVISFLLFAYKFRNNYSNNSNSLPIGSI